MKKKQVLILIIPVIIILTAVSIQALGATKCANLGAVVCGQDIDSTMGTGAFELCDTCFLCGNNTDGICPEEFSDGGFELINITLQKVTWYLDDSYRTIPLFDNGTEACWALYGNDTSCKKLYYSEKGSAWDNPPGGEDCDTNIGGLTPKYDYLVDCKVPAVARCYNCPDPQCNVTITGKVTDYKTYLPLVGVEVEAVFPLNPSLYYETTTGGNGFYQMTVPTGNYKMGARVFGYDVLIKDVSIQPGNDTVDFQLANGTCHADCTGFHYPEFPPRCKAGCEGFNNGTDTCNFPTTYPQYDVASACNEKVLESKIVLEAHEDGNSTVVICCEGPIFNETRPRINITTSRTIKDLITTTIVKEMNEQPVKVKIIVWNE
jgi:hypothetical protein